jgi:hypothetical protein
VSTLSTYLRGLLDMLAEWFGIRWACRPGHRVRSIQAQLGAVHTLVMEYEKRANERAILLALAILERNGSVPEGVKAGQSHEQLMATLWANLGDLPAEVASALRAEFDDLRPGGAA